MKQSHFNPNLIFSHFYAKFPLVLVTSYYFKRTENVFFKTACTDNSTLFLKFTHLGLLVQLQRPFNFIGLAHLEKVHSLYHKNRFLSLRGEGSQVVLVERYIVFLETVVLYFCKVGK